MIQKRYHSPQSPKIEWQHANAMLFWLVLRSVLSSEDACFLFELCDSISIDFMNNLLYILPFYRLYALLE